MYNNPINMPDELYQNILTALKKEVAKKGKMLFAVVPNFLLQNFNISYKQYSNGESFENWLLKAFPIKRADLLNFTFDGADTVVSGSMDDLPESLRKCAEVFRSCINEDGYLYLAEFPSKLKETLEKIGITYAELTGGKKTSVWLESWATPYFELYDNNQRIKLRQTDILQETEKKEDEIKQMHSFAVSWWSDHIKYFKRREDGRYNADSLKILISHKLARVLLGVDGPLYNAVNDGDTPRVAFDTGIKSPDNLPIYCVLEKNRLNTDGKKQHWALAGFACSDDQNNPLWDWLSQTFPAVAITVQDTESDLEDIERTVTELDDIKALLSEIMPEITKSISLGTDLPGNAFSLIKKYHKGWVELSRMTKNNPWLDEGLTTLEQIHEGLQSGDSHKKEFEAVLADFDRLCENTQKLFAELRLPIEQGTETTVKDREIIASCLNRSADAGCVKELLSLLSNYQSLKTIAYAQGIDSATDKAFDIFSSHFTEIRAVDINRFLFDLPQDMRGFLNSADTVKEALIKLSLPAEQEQTVPVTADMLLEMLENKTKKYQFDTSLIFARRIPQNELEKALAYNMLSKAQELIGDSTFMEKAGYDTELCTEYLNALGELPEALSQLTLLNAAERISRVLGSAGTKTAEKYLLLAINSHFEQSFYKLLSIYKNNGDKASFIRLLDCFPTAKLSYEHQAFYVELLCNEGFDPLFKYLSSNIHLMYDRDTMSTVIENLPGDTPETRRRQLEAIFEISKQKQQPNEFEALAEKGVRSAIIEYIGTGDSLAELGYTAEETEKINRTLTDEIPQGDTAFDKASRLYALQGNKNRTAEHLYWQALSSASEGAVTAVAEKLISIMANEQRWYEISLVYNCYPADCSVSALCRTAYIASLMESADPSLTGFVYNNFTDWLKAMLSRSADPAELKIQQKTKEQTDAELQKFFESLENIKDSVSEGFIKSIALIDSDLRSLVLQHDALTAMGLSPAQTDACAVTYKTDNFSHERSVLSVAERIYSFIGNLNGTAENIARFAADYESKAVYFLWDIYVKEGSPKKTELLLKYDFLRPANKGEYRKALLKVKDFTQLYNELQNEQSPDGQDSLLIAIVKIKSGMEYSLFDTETDFENTESFIVKELISTMLEAGKTDMACEFIIDSFCSMMSAYSASVIKDEILPLGEDVLEAVQSKAVASQKPEAAIFLYNHCGIGELSDYAENYYTDAISDADSSQEQGEKIYSVLGCLYPDKKELEKAGIKFKIVRTLNQESVTEETLDRLGNELSEISLSENTLRELLEHFKAVNISLSETLCISLIRLCTECNMQKECIDALHTVIANYDIPSTSYFYHFICQLYLENIDYTAADSERLSAAKDVCKKVFAETKSCFTAFCLYFLYKTSGDRSGAAMALRFLSKKDENELENILPEQVDAEVTSFFARSVPSPAMLFGQYIENSGTEQLGEFFETAALFEIIYEPVQPATPYEQNSDITNSEQQINAILSELGHSPDSAACWLSAVRLPLDIMPKAYISILRKACIKNPAKKGLWKKCIEFCELNEYEDTLLEVLYLFAKLAPTYNEMQYYRELLVKKINADDGYLSRFCDSDILYKTVELHCKRLKGEYHNASSHAAIKDLSIIAVNTQNGQIFDMFWSYYGQTLLTEHGNLCFAVVCRFISDGRTELAQNLLKQLSQSGFSLKYANIVKQLSAMDRGQIENWSGQQQNRMLMSLILPEGNQPSSDDLNLLVLSCVENKEQQTGARVLMQLLKEFPTDYGAYNALFTLCKSDFEDRLKMLHFAVCGLIQNSAGNSRSYYKRTAVDYAKMLAYINTAAQHLGIFEDIAASDGYSVNMSAGDYYRAFNSDIASAAEINSFQQDAERMLSNRSEDEKRMMCSALISWVTNDWHGLFEECIEKNIPLYELLGEFEFFNDGFVRSVLSFINSKPEEQKTELFNAITSVPVISRGKEKEQLVKLVGMDPDEYAEYISVDILDYPIEEWCMFGSIYNATINRLLHTAPDKVADCAFMIGLLADNPTSVFSNYIPRAFYHFEKGSSSAAASLFGALNKLKVLRHFRTEMTKPSASMPAISMPKYYNDYEKVEAMLRIANTFAQEPETIIKVSHPDFNPWSCMNMVLQLLYTKRAGEIETLKSYFCTENQKLTDTILTVVDPNIEDSDKLEAIEEYHGREIIAYLYFFAKIGYNGSVPKYLKSHNAAEELNSRYLKLTETHPQYFKDRSPRQLRHTILIMDNVNATVFNKKEAAASTPESVVQKAVISQTAEYTFGQDIEPITDPQISLEQLQKEYDSIKITKIDAADERYAKMKLSEKMYGVALGKYFSSVQKSTDYLLRYGVDCYYYYSTPSVLENNKNAANDIIKQLVLIPAESKSEGYKALMQTIRSGALKKLLYNSSSVGSLNTLVDDYITNKTAYINMSALLSDPKEKKCAEAFYDVFQTISDGYASIANMRDIYMSAREKLSRLGQIPWSEINNKLLGQITEEINLIDKKPELNITILNKSISSQNGYLFGVITNTGREKANDIILQAIYNNGKTSHQYSLRTLGKEAKATFEIDYTLENDESFLDFEIIVSYSYDEQEQKIPIYKSVLKVSDTEFDGINNTNLYSSETVADFYCDESGQIVSPNFYGRAAEKRQIHNMFSGEFINYKSSIIRGIRRAGKTSMLNYLISYVKNNCDDAIVVFVDCQDIRDKGIQKYVFTVFIKMVIAELALEYPDICSGESWDVFVNKWTKSNPTDIDPAELQYFYRELFSVTGKGLVLVIDEIDILFEEIEITQGLDHSLFPALGKILCSSACQKAVKFIFCGSNQLIRYGFDGGTLNQLFQRFGSNVVEIGKLPYNDMREMLTKPTENTKIQWTEDALIWMYEFTDGLVWYTKLLANNILKHLQEKKRYVIYPYDVVIKRSSILDDNNFGQINKGTKEKERLIMDALQSLSSSSSQYISIERILERLEGQMTAKEIEDIIRNLIDLQMIQIQNISGNRQYRFTSALYWHYFRSVSSGFQRAEEIPQIFDMLIDFDELMKRRNNKKENLK